MPLRALSGLVAVLHSRGKTTACRNGNDAFLGIKSGKRDMEFNELIVAFGAKHGIEGLDGADGVAELDVGGTRVEVLEDTHANGLLMYNLQWLVVGVSG